MRVHLTRRLTLEERQGGSDGAGGQVGGWTALGVHWGAIVSRQGRYERGEGYPRSRVPHRITIRSMPPDAPSRPKPGQRFREGDRLFYIRSVQDLGPRLRFLMVAVDEEVAA